MAHIQDRRYRVGASGKRERTSYTGDKPYKVRYRGPDGRERSKAFSHKRDALLFEADIETSMSRGTWVDARLGKITLEEWVAMVQPTLTGFRDSTRARDDSYLRSHVLPAFGQAPLSAIDHLSVQGWVAGLEEKDYAPETVKKAFEILSRYLKEAVRAGRLASNPAAEVRLPKKVRTEMRFLDSVEVARLADAIDPRYRAFVTLGAYSGLRAGEMIGLRVKNVDVLRRRIEVTEQLQEVRGHLKFGPPKTDSSHRSVSVPPLVIEALSPHLVGRDREDTVFVAPRGGPIRLSQFRAHVWKKALRDSGLGDCRIHDLRHTAVAFWIAGDASPLEIARRAGHSSVSVVLDRYGHLQPGAETAVDDKLEEMARAGQEAAAQFGKVIALR